MNIYSVQFSLEYDRDSYGGKVQRTRCEGVGRKLVGPLFKKHWTRLFSWLATPLSMSMIHTLTQKETKPTTIVEIPAIRKDGKGFKMQPTNTETKTRGRKAVALTSTGNTMNIGPLKGRRRRSLSISKHFPLNSHGKTLKAGRTSLETQDPASSDGQDSRTPTVHQNGWIHAERHGSGWKKSGLKGEGLKNFLRPQLRTSQSKVSSSPNPKFGTSRLKIWVWKWRGRGRVKSRLLQLNPALKPGFLCSLNIE